MAMQSAIVNSGSVILQSGINGLGQYVIAGHTAARKLYMFCNMPFTSMGQGIATFISQNKVPTIRAVLEEVCLMLIFMTLLLL